MAEFPDQILGRSFVSQRGSEAIVLESRGECVERKPSSQSIINKGKGTVCSIHRSDQIEVGRNKESFVRALGVCQRNAKLLAPLIGFDEHHHLTKNLTQVAAVNLVNDEEVLVLWVPLSTAAEIIKDARLDLEATGAVSANPLNEVLVGVRLVKLRHLYA